MSRLSGSIASRIFAGRNTLAITVGAVSESAQIHRHESYDFVFSGLVPVVTFDGMLHDVSLTYIYNAIAGKRVDKRNPPKRVLVISVTRYAYYFYLNFPLLASIADFPIREVRLPLSHVTEQCDLHDTLLDGLDKIA